MNPRVLLVDDDPFAQDLVKAILQTAGYEIDIASDGFAALKLLRDYPYRFALIDYHMPEMDGYVLAKLLRDIAGSAGVPLKLAGMTADRNGLAARRGADALFDIIVVKPFEPQKLIDIVNEIFFKRSAKIQEMRDAAEALLAEPGFERARSAALAFWRNKDLLACPKIFVVPEPTVDQARDLGICFEMVNDETADVIVLMDVYGLEPLSRLRAEYGLHLPPVVTLDKSLLSIADVYFHVGDTQSWANVAERIAGRSSADAMEEGAFSRESSDCVHHDMKIFEKITQFLGPERSETLLTQFTRMLESSFIAGQDRPEERRLLMKQAKATSYVAEQLGFGRLAETCRELEASLDQRKELTRPLHKVKAAKLRSMRTLSQLRPAPVSGQ